MPTEVLQVVETKKSLFILFIAYEEADIAGAVGHVYSDSGKRDKGAVPPQVLDTNDTLRVMWASAKGAVWVGSADGNVGTTSSVRWPAPAKGTRYTTLSGSEWAVTALPRVKATGLRPNITALWGTGDSDVYAGTYGGHIYRWDGETWAQVYEGPGSGANTIRAFGGSPKDVYAVGLQSTILHFDGREWRRLRAPEPTNGDHEGFTGVLRLPDGETLISGSGDEGRLIVGSAAGGFDEFGGSPLQLIDMAAMGERVLFATGDGVAELTGRDVKMIKSTFKTATMNSGINRIFFIEPAQNTPSFIEYNPKIDAAPWWRFTF